MFETRPIRVLFNDWHGNSVKGNTVASGGPAQFAQSFSKIFGEKYKKDIALSSILFSHNNIDERIYYRELKNGRTFYDIVYPRRLVLDSFKKEWTKQAYKKLLAPLSLQVDEVIKKLQPDIVFLNGYSLSNWILLDAAHRAGIPVCIQHAGIWKKEIFIAPRGAFSPSIKRIFASFEKEVIAKASAQIFLNEFSKKVFFKMHHTVLTPALQKKLHVVGLPFADTYKASVPCKIGPVGKKVGMIARWDSIKNHSAMLRLAKYNQKQGLGYMLSSVTSVPESGSNFAVEYGASVQVIPPMLPKDLRVFIRLQDAILLLSRFDVSPTVVMEAVLSGVPVIISKNVGWVDVFKKFKLTKCIVDPTASGEKISNAIGQIFKNNAHYRTHFKALQTYFLTKHSKEAIFAEYYKIFIRLTQ